MNLKKILIGTDADANLGGFIENVGQMGFPAPAVMGFLAAFAESFGAILLAIGLLTRPAAFLIAATMAGAALKVHAGQGFSGQEMAWLYFFPALFFLLKGAGQWSVDAILSKKTG
jgi:putative oxidoreductase